MTEKSCGVLASHQPDFFPYMGYFYKVFQSDVFVFSDNVLFSKTGRHNYNEILTPNGPHRLTLPVHYHVVNLNEMELAAGEKTVEKMLKTLRESYGKAEHFRDVYPILEGMFFYARYAKSLAAFNQYCLMTLIAHFGLMDGRQFFVSSKLPLTERRDKRIIQMCELFGARAYCSGDGAKDYHIEQDYADHGIRLLYSDYQPISYPQTGGREAPNMSVIDYAMNCGFQIPRGWKKWTR